MFGFIVVTFMFISTVYTIYRIGRFAWSGIHKLVYRRVLVHELQRADALILESKREQRVEGYRRRGLLPAE